MEQNLEVAVLFFRQYFKERNITVLIPERVISGKCIQDSKFFIDNQNNKKIKNMDEANYQNQNYGYYFATPIKELQKQYGTKDLDIVLKNYMDDICSKVHYYTEFDEENFESYLLKSDLIEDFNKKYDVKFKYRYDDRVDDMNQDEVSSTETEEIDTIGKDIFNINKELKNNILFQDRAIEKITQTIYNNCILGNECNNILISGSNGVGKTKALKTLAQKTTHPVVYCSIKEEYADENLDAYDILNDLLSRLHDDAINNNKTDDHSIIILDDFEKLDCVEIYEIQEELQNFLSTKKRIIKNKKMAFCADKITFIICGNFSDVKTNINIPQNFFLNPKFKVDETDLSLDNTELVDKHMFLESLLPYFNTKVLFDNLDLDKTKQIISTLKNEFLLLYINQLRKQGVKEITLEDGLIDALATAIYSKNSNLKNYDTIVKIIFSEIMKDSLDYLGQPVKLYIKNEILEKDKKGYQFTLKK